MKGTGSVIAMFIPTANFSHSVFLGLNHFLESAFAGFHEVFWIARQSPNFFETFQDQINAGYKLILYL